MKPWFTPLSLPPYPSFGFTVNISTIALFPCHLCPQALWPKLRNLQWMHSASAGLEHVLFPELVEGPVTLTNAKVRGYTEGNETKVVGMVYVCV